MEPWRSLLQELADVLETEFAKLQKPERLAEGLGADSADAAFGRAATVPPKPTSLPCSPYTRSEDQVSHLESSWVLAKALPSLPSVAADEEDLNSDAVDDVTRSIKSFVTQSSMGSAASAQRGRSERTHFRVVRATKSCHRLQKKPWYVINPDQSKFAGRWQALVACCLLFVALVTPVQVALLEPEFHWIFLVGIFVDAVFAVDLFLQFITAYPVTTPQGITWEIQASKIRSRYLKSWFGLDILSILPFDVLTLALEANELRELQALKVIRALRLMKPPAFSTCYGCGCGKYKQINCVVMSLRGVAGGGGWGSMVIIAFASATAGAIALAPAPVPAPALPLSQQASLSFPSTSATPPPARQHSPAQIANFGQVPPPPWPSASASREELVFPGWGWSWGGCGVFRPVFQSAAAGLPAYLKPHVSWERFKT